MWTDSHVFTEDLVEFGTADVEAFGEFLDGDAVADMVVHELDGSLDDVTAAGSSCLDA